MSFPRRDKNGKLLNTNRKLSADAELADSGPGSSDSSDKYDIKKQEYARSLSALADCLS
jgi:hypothetical protein